MWLTGQSEAGDGKREGASPATGTQRQVPWAAVCLEKWARPWGVGVGTHKECDLACSALHMQEVTFLPTGFGSSQTPKCLNWEEGGLLRR